MDTTHRTFRLVVTLALVTGLSTTTGCASVAEARTGSADTGIPRSADAASRWLRVEDLRGRRLVELPATVPEAGSTLRQFQRGDERRRDRAARPGFELPASATLRQAMRADEQRRAAVGSIAGPGGRSTPLRQLQRLDEPTTPSPVPPAVTPTPQPSPTPKSSPAPTPSPTPTPAPPNRTLRQLVE